MAQKNNMVSNALEEISEYIAKNTWLSEIQAFCVTWSSKSAKEFRGKAAFTIEVSEVISLVYPCNW